MADWKTHIENCPIMSRVAAAPAAVLQAPSRITLFATGFRPFFLLAGLIAALWVPLWLLVQQGEVASTSYLPANVWHGHEMIFGYAVAVLAGFLLTAGQNWTGLPTARGVHLAGLALLWLAGRVLLLVDAPPLAAAIFDLAFIPALGITVAVPLLRARNHRNLVFLGVLAALFALNLLVHLGAMDVIAWDGRRVFWLALDVFVLVIALVGGRIVPSFTANAVPQAKVRSRAWIERPALAVLALLLLADAAMGEGPAVGALALLAAALHAVRLAGWDGRATRRTPILWVLHLGYLWLVAGLALRGVAAFVEAIPDDAALHALGAGAIGTMTLAMMTRVALGHGGRRIVAAPAIVGAYLLVSLAAIARVAGSFFLGSAGYDHALTLAGLLWAVAFLLFVVVYAPILVRPRADGRPG